MTLKENFNLIIISLVIFSSKWFFSFLIFPEDFIFTKILLDTPDSQYYPIIKSLSDFDFSPGYNLFDETENVFIFPYGPIIWHAIFYKIFGTISFFIVEYIFIFLFLWVFFNIFKSLDFSSLVSLLLSSLILILPTITNLLIDFSIPYIQNLNTTLNYIYSTRFPRPQITGLYFLLFIYLTIKFYENFFNNFKSNYAILFAILIGLLANSFFYFALYALFTLLIILTINTKKQIFRFLIDNKNFFLIFFLILILTFLPIIYQNIYGEKDLSGRIALFKISFEERIFILKYFIKSFLRLEAVLLILSALSLKIFIDKVYEKNLSRKLDIFFYVFLSSIAAPLFFVSFSPKIIALYHFADYFLVNGILYLFFSISFIIYQLSRKISFSKLEKKLITYSTITFILIIFSFNHFNDLAKVNNRDDFNKIFEILEEYSEKDLAFLTNDPKFATYWIFNKNKNLILSDGFTNTLKDEQIIKNFVKGFKLLHFNSEEFYDIIDFKNKNTNRSNLMMFLFNYKYQANQLKQFSLDSEYNKDELQLIKSTSPFRVMSQIVPENEKKFLINKFSNINIDNGEFGKFVTLLNLNDLPGFVKKKEYIGFEKIFFSKNYILLKKN